jgi:hypothetical protein
MLPCAPASFLLPRDPAGTQTKQLGLGVEIHFALFSVITSMPLYLLRFELTFFSEDNYVDRNDTQNFLGATPTFFY